MRLIDQYRGLKKEVYVLFFGQIVTSMGAMIWALLTLILNQKMGLDASTIAILVTLAGVLMLPANLWGGKLADRCNKKKIIIYADLVSRMGRKRERAAFTVASLTSTPRSSRRVV